ncbi:fibronectin type III domain-containing protein [Methanoregula sp. UBA64]|uniref:fibronectin type III domain-containing protein n=1 Tax=Methanoregula sp. UBA64 TaxID=1915554 RepID=UPI0025FC34C5|nr:fibronectin type III domain-containing protein [Methanoregula sp. UBA64]
MTLSGDIALITYNISATGIDDKNATITWKTNGNANSTVEYGTTTDYGSTSSDAVMKSSHMIGLYSLSSHTTYHYRVRSTTIDSISATSGDATFTTLYSTGTPVATQSQGTTFSGVTATTTNGAQQVNLTHSTLTGTTSVSGNTVTVSNPGNGWSSLKYTGTVQQDAGLNISISNVQRVVMESTPVTTDLGGSVGAVSTKISVPLTQPVTGTPLQQNIIAGATSSATSAFQLAATSSSLDIKSVAYTVEFTNTDSVNANLGGDGVTLNLGIDHAWVDANGGRGAIKILRSGEDGRKEVLTTHYTTSSGSTDYFEAVSPHGLSVFGIAAVASTGGNNGGGNSGGGDTGGGGGSGDGGQAGGFFSALFGAPAAPPAAPALPPQRAPYEKNVTVTTRSLSVAGLMATRDTAGLPTLHLATRLAEQSGANISVQGNVITINQPGFALTLETRDIPHMENDVISGTISGAGVSTAPAFAQTDAGNVSVAVSTPITGIPENAVISIAIPQAINRDIVDAFRSAAESASGELTGIAYSASVDTINLTAAGPATVTMTISPEWVHAYGGISAITIARLDDDGTAELLVTNYSGTDPAENLVFVGSSPKGFSTFGLVSVKHQNIPVQTSPEPASPASSSTPAGMDNVTTGIPFVGDPLLLIMGLVVCVVAGLLGVVIYWIRFRKPAKKDSKKG